MLVFVAIDDDDHCGQFISFLMRVLPVISGRFIISSMAMSLSTMDVCDGTILTDVACPHSRASDSC